MQHPLETTGAAVALVLEKENPAWKADGLDLQYVKVYAVDNGNHWSDDLLAGNKKVLHNGFAMGILHAGRVPGAVELRVSAPGLQGIEQTFNVR